MTVVLDVRVVAGAGGGPDKTILNSPRFLAPDGYRMLCAYMRPPGDPGFGRIRERAMAWGAPMIEVDDRAPWDVGVVGRLLAICRRERVAIWHGHDYKSNILGLMLRPFWPMRLVTTVHGWGVRGGRTALYYTVDRFCLPHYERVIAVSGDLLESCLAAGVRPDRCILMENGVDTTQFARRAGAVEAKARLGLPPGRYVVGAVGRLSAEKGFDLLVRAVDRLLAAGNDLDLLIVGEGPERSRLEALVAELGRGDRVHLTGFRSDVAPLYEAMDAYVLSSVREGLPNAVLEAMALEVPVVATRIAGLPRLLAEGRDGLLIEPGSVDAIADALSRLLADPALGGRLRRAGRATVESSYCFAARMGKLRRLYDELLGRSVPTDPILPKPEP